MRRNAIDVARVSALIVVVLGHLTLAVIDRPHGHIRGANLLALHPSWAFVAALAPMPVFFAAAGWAHVTSSLETASARLAALLGLGAVVVATWSVGVGIAVGLNGHAGVFGDGARIATQPLWFVAGYAPLVPLGARLGRLGRDHALAAVTIALGTLAALDVARFTFGAPEWIGWIGFYLVWGTPWLLGGWWRARHEAGGFDERRVGLALMAGAVVVGTVLVLGFGYAPALIDAVPGARSNTTPPGLYTCVAAIGQVGALMTLGTWLDNIGARWRHMWDRAGELSLGIYAWHLTALSLCGAVLAAGFPAPTRLTTLWWLTRPLWYAAVLGLATLFVLATSGVRAQLRRRSRADTAPPQLQAALGVVLAVAGGATVGLRGPRSLPLAAWCAAFFVGSWLLLRRRVSSPESGGPSTPAQTTQPPLPLR
ncbi:MAG TPA: acyltransferase family protein [Acidimicrobiales bacterium]|nr:acyltransferase family protein [Acidimicrobiales bacterium]